MITRKLLALERHPRLQCVGDPFPKRAVLRLPRNHSRSVVAAAQQRFASRQIKSGPVRFAAAVAGHAFGLEYRLDVLGK